MKFDKANGLVEDFKGLRAVQYIGWGQYYDTHA